MVAESQGRRHLGAGIAENNRHWKPWVATSHRGVVCWSPAPDSDRDALTDELESLQRHVIRERMYHISHDTDNYEANRKGEDKEEGGDLSDLA